MKTIKANRKSLLCIIHTHPQYKTIKENNAWESWLLVRYGVESCKALCDEELREVIGIFNGHISDRDFVKREHRGEMISGSQERKIAALLALLGWGDGAYCKFVKRQIGDLKLPHTLSKSEATCVITGLQKIVGER
ncbi:MULTISPECIES: phage protein GemA/Gp16 family protein [Helicobacter]|uniref:phage protein GemA/Gp16 family protein n=1 Tax=Helicobacter TaxID=209 RepID=UPI0025DD1B3A|nr:phage protein GemA/Gp16 family protein [Helicobacter rodentium]